MQGLQACAADLGAIFDPQGERTSLCLFQGKGTLIIIALNGIAVCADMHVTHHLMDSGY